MHRVLIVDDEVWMCEYVKTFIPWRKLRFDEPRCALSAEQALALLKEMPADVLLTDIRMPGMDGIALAQEAKKRYPSMKVILLTAHEDFGYARSAIRNGVFGYLLKSDPADEITEYFRELREVLELEASQGAQEAPLREQGGLLPLALSYIQEHFREDITLARLGQAMHVHPVHLSRVLTQQYGKSYREIVSELRLKEAKRLLRETYLPIHTVAEAVGHSKASYFSEWFKKHTGASPQEFREGIPRVDP